MNNLKEIAKGGWHPESKDGGKGGGKPSWRGDFKGVNTVAGWMGKGKDPHEAARQHQSEPLSTLKDPATFGPPPKRAIYQGATAASGSATADRSGSGVPVAQERVGDIHPAEQAAEDVVQEPVSPPVPFRADTTGLSTANLPKPPTRRADPSSQSPTSATQRPKPSLPPRLPPRQNSHPNAYTPQPPPSYTDGAQQPSREQGNPNRTALNRLGQAGVSVPGLNIGRTASPSVPLHNSGLPNSSTDAPASPLAGGRGPQLSELQARFSKMSTSSPPTTANPATGTSFAQKQAAMKTASSFKNDPTSVSASDLRSAASTANNFRERHGEQVASGWSAAKNLNQRYNLTDRMNSHTFNTTTTPQASGATVSAGTHGSAQGGIGKKLPPPPPPKRIASGDGAPQPPPIPLGSKPRP